MPQMRLHQHILGKRTPQLWSIWECRQCGYRGAFVIEDSKLATKIRGSYLKSVEEKRRMKA